MDCSLPGSSVHGILRARIVDWAAMPSPENLPDPGIEPMSLISPALAVWFFTTSTNWAAQSGDYAWEKKTSFKGLLPN